MENTEAFLPDEPVKTYTLSRKNVSKEQHSKYMKAYQKRRYDTDPEYRQTQINNAKIRYRNNKLKMELLENTLKEFSIQNIYK